ncbi:LysR family transcriptional regulator [Actinocrispum wychmicini]|uniref:DNA-binding transcriptional LysR family regulator n=1 Tax=Actinocrispum wychmicini TaxID=1213861 RepID=A0A4R2IKZ1_9PSEU|nr:LysR family transcriptional regulator [Actinocrispum wychmicini]TCO45357.1 DNA-binding transcriptional LysR family regulator [Actinocrispum wychmicini]
MTGLRLELRHLKVIAEIARAGSIRKAASAMRIAQPALAAQLQRIEQAVGGRVFDRTRTGVRPTALGRYLIGAGGDLLGDFDRLIAETAALARQPAPVGVGAMRNVDTAGIIGAVSDVMPRVETSTRELESLDAAFALLHAGELDIALLYRFANGTPFPDTLCQWPVVAVEPAFVGLPAGHPLAGLPEIPLSALAGESWIISCSDDGTGRLTAFRRACTAAGFTPRIRHHAGDCETTIPLLLSTESVAVMHPLCVPPEGVVIRPVAGSPHYRTVTLAWRPDAPTHHLIPMLHKRLVRSYHIEVSTRPDYRRWWQATNGPLVATAPPGTPTAPVCGTDGLHAIPNHRS